MDEVGRVFFFRCAHDVWRIHAIPEQPANPKTTAVRNEWR